MQDQFQAQLNSLTRQALAVDIGQKVMEAAESRAMLQMQAQELESLRQRLQEAEGRLSELTKPDQASGD